MLSETSSGVYLISIILCCFIMEHEIVKSRQSYLFVGFFDFLLRLVE
jgi:hypothetical protein